MKLDLYQIDAFAEQVFEGNPAAVCPLPHWLDDTILQKIAQENNLSETAFFVAEGPEIGLRWFTPAAEVDLCGHATLATAHVLYEHLGYDSPEIVFSTRSGRLNVEKTEQGLSMDFPASPPETVDAPAELLEGLGVPAQSVLAAFDYVVVLDNETQVRALRPNLLPWKALNRRGVVVTAPGETVDFVSRCFFPKLGVDEDPVTGSAHCELAPYWRLRLNRDQLTAQQVSRRGGHVACQVIGDRVRLTGRAVDYMQGRITL